MPENPSVKDLAFALSCGDDQEEINAQLHTRRQKTKTKSSDAYLTIGEVAAELGLPQHVLRFWESKFPQLKPLKRHNGRRYYRPDDVSFLRCLRDLLHRDGYTIKGVQKLIKEQGRSRFVAAGHALEKETDTALHALLGSEATAPETDLVPEKPSSAPPPRTAPKITSTCLAPESRENLKRLREDLSHMQFLLRAHL